MTKSIRKLGLCSCLYCMAWMAEWQIPTFEPEQQTKISVSDQFEVFSLDFDQAIFPDDDRVVCCENLPPVGAIISGTIRAGYEQLKYSIWRNHRILSGTARPEDIPYRRYVLQKETWTGKYQVVYKVFATEPDKNLKLAHNTFAGLDLLAMLSTTGGAPVMMAKTPGVVSAEAIRKIAEQFNNLECVACVNAIVANLKKAGIRGEIVTLRASSSKKGFIYSFTARDVISRSGMHKGVLVNGKVYDNIHKSGINYEKWLRDFDVIKGFKEPVKTKF